jgi:hypothetical protein
VAGLRPREDNVVELHPLLPQGVWQWFCLDGVSYHGKTLTVLWDQSGKEFGMGQGLRIFVDGKLLASAPQLRRITASLPS